jgi:serine O-acetyltransferase
MITSKDNLKEYLCSDNQWLPAHGAKEKLIERMGYYPAFALRKYLRLLRKQEYYINTARGNRMKWLASMFYEGRKNRLGMRLGIEIGPNCFGKGLNIYHGNLVINSDVRVGENCSLHGANCIGNNGLSTGVPKLGNNVDVGYGAIIIGDITVADNVKIGANAVVNCSVTEPGCTVVGVPARVVKRAGQ